MSMHILDAMQSAAVRLVGQRPGGFFSSTEAFEQEIANLATETAVGLMKAHDWRKLTKLCTLTGDGSKTAFDLPDDYDRMTMDGDVHPASASGWQYEPADLDHWIELISGEPGAAPGYWIILGGQMQFQPAISLNGIAKFFYVSNYIAAAKSAFNSDDDVFLLESRLLTLGLIWRWRAMKKMDYGEDLASYEVALEDNIARDKGARTLVQPRRWRGFGDLKVGYPG